MSEGSDSAADVVLVSTPVRPLSHQQYLETPPFLGIDYENNNYEPVNQVRPRREEGGALVRVRLSCENCGRMIRDFPITITSKIFTQFSKYSIAPRRLLASFPSIFRYKKLLMQ
jgi:hypothetical protein